MRGNRGLVIHLARTRCPASERRRGSKGAKLILACSAILVFSARISTGPSASTTASTRSNVARTTGAELAKWRSRSPSRAHVCVWLRFAKVRPHSGHAHMGLTRAAYGDRQLIDRSYALQMTGLMALTAQRASPALPR